MYTSLSMDEVEFREKNIEDLSDLYRAICKISWIGKTRVPKFEVFVEFMTTMIVPKVTPPPLPDWLEREAEEELRDEDDEIDSEIFL